MTLSSSDVRDIREALEDEHGPGVVVQLSAPRPEWGVPFAQATAGFETVGGFRPVANYRIGFDLESEQLLLEEC